MRASTSVPQRNLQIAFQRGLVLWHNDGKGECVNMFSPSLNAIERRRVCMIRRITLPAIGAILLLAAPAPRAQNAAQPGEKSETSPAGNAETGKKIFTKDGCYECHGREGQGARSSVWSAHRAVATFRSPLHQVRPPTDRPDAAVHQRGHLRSGTRRHLCVSAVKANGYTLQGHSAAESIARLLWRRRPAGGFSQHRAKTPARRRRHKNKNFSAN